MTDGRGTMAAGTAEAVDRDVRRSRTADVGGPPADGAVHRGAAGPGAALRLGDLAAAAVRVDASTRLATVDAMFRRDPALPWVVLDGGGPPILVSRAWWATLTTGRRGRRRLRRKRLADVAPPRGPVLPADLPVTLAAAEL